jgi:hypothetical protein
MLELSKLILFTIYTIVYECLIWGLTASAIYYLHWSEWTVLVGMIMSGSQLKPNHFGLNYSIGIKPEPKIHKIKK